MFNIVKSHTLIIIIIMIIKIKIKIKNKKLTFLKCLAKENKKAQISWQIEDYCVFIAPPIARC
jgi:hypothetical protein